MLKTEKDVKVITADVLEDSNLILKTTMKGTDYYKFDFNATPVPDELEGDLIAVEQFKSKNLKLRSSHRYLSFSIIDTDDENPHLMYINENSARNLHDLLGKYLERASCERFSESDL